MLLHLVADYGAGDLAFAEVQQRLALELGDVDVVPIALAPFDTLGAGFCVAQLALTPGPPGRVVVHNVAPRRDEHGPRRANAGEPFVAVRTHDDVLVVGPNAGWSLSFLAPHAHDARTLAVPVAGSQFRSRDYLPRAVADLLAGRQDVLGDGLDLTAVPAVPERVIAYTDGYGNLKTTVTEPPAAAGERVTVRIGDVSATAIVGDGTFEVAEGELAFAPGSSGWKRPDGSPERFFELLLRGASAAERFAHPATGAMIQITAADD